MLNNIEKPIRFFYNINKLLTHIIGIIKSKKEITFTRICRNSLVLVINKYILCVCLRIFKY